MTVMKNNKVALVAERRGSLYYLDAAIQKLTQDEVHVVKSETVRLWHQRLGHPAHSDLWGPSSVNSVGGGRYYMSIIDDFSRKCWIYILKEKSEALKIFCSVVC